LKKLDRDDALYATYFDYKSPLSAPFEETFDKRWASPGIEQERGWCGLCREAARSLHKRSADTPVLVKTSVGTEERPPVNGSFFSGKCLPAGKFDSLAPKTKKKDSIPVALEFPYSLLNF
jgi:hypothetical protein